MSVALAEEFCDSPQDLERHIPRAIEQMRQDGGGREEFWETCQYAIRDSLLKYAKDRKNQHEPLLVGLCVACFETKAMVYYDLAYDILREKKLVNWKGHEDGIQRICQVLQEPITWTHHETKNEWKWHKNRLSGSHLGRALVRAISTMIEACSRDKTMRNVNGHFASLVTSCLKSATPMHMVVAYAVLEASDISWEGCEKQMPAVLEEFNRWIRGKSANFAQNFDHMNVADYVTRHGMMEVTGKSSTEHLKFIMEFCLQHELEGDERPFSTYGKIVYNILNNFILKNSGKPKVIKDLFPYAMSLLSSEQSDIRRSVGFLVSHLFQHGEMLAPYGKEIVEAFIDGRCERSSIGCAFKGIYQYNPEVIMSQMDRLIDLLDDLTNQEKVSIYMLFNDVVQQSPEALEDHVDDMIDDISDLTLTPISFMTLAQLSVHCPERFVKHLDFCLKTWEKLPMTVTSASKMIANIGRVSKQQADQCLQILFGRLPDANPMWTGVILMEAKRLGQAYKTSLEPYRPEIEKLKTYPQSGIPEVVQMMLDFLDDITLHGLSENVTEQREDIDKLDSRVTNTENDVKVLDETVKQQGDDIENVKNEVHEQGEKLEELKEVVDETVEKVEEIDRKTITNAPKWSRDVSKLLNPEHEHDWRFLAVRLGYSGEDIRNWALSPDPTMAILAEWFTTHKSSDATYAILSALEDMGRTDAAEIITQSLEEAELLVPEASSDDSEKPPAIFLSYQWDHQPEVKAIRKHLEMAGFPCWMDIGQMGGGDQLFARISQGMRSAKVVLCMVTEKYSGSENCNKEVNLANLLNKPIIPILIDRTPWPPEGAMSMLFSQLLYIQFYNEKEYVRGEKFWDDAKFSELLGQISYHVNPDETMVTEEYRNWIPQVEDKPAVVKKVEETSSSTPPKTDTQEPLEHPSVFISYQWGKQPEIKRLFSRLTGLGYHCWLDINQMGGGDPLYSKIDKGIRNAKVVVSCVTPKYALSANCRREVSLSDALRKPVVPLLMEQMTWPPEGPMSMTFTQLLYIDFTKETSQAKFDDEKFDELLLKIQEHAQPTLQLETVGDEADQSTDQEEDDEGTQEAVSGEEQPDEGRRRQSEEIQDNQERSDQADLTQQMEIIEENSSHFPVQENGTPESQLASVEDERESSNSEDQFDEESIEMKTDICTKTDAHEFNGSDAETPSGSEETGQMELNPTAGVDQQRALVHKEPSTVTDPSSAAEDRHLDESREDKVDTCITEQPEEQLATDRNQEESDKGGQSPGKNVRPSSGRKQKKSSLCLII
ncbi:uncharacterized protein [Diadema antillarum]|uniref:uncharacterized protein n=1 Tax=Diadema antillarum TaxID=105358 RepID=UPI003A866716